MQSPFGFLCFSKTQALSPDGMIPEQGAATALRALCLRLLIATVAVTAMAAVGWALWSGLLWPLWLPAAVGALGLGQGHDAQVQPALLGALQDPVWRVREEAAATLGKLKLPEAVGPLIQSLQDTSLYHERSRSSGAGVSVPITGGRAGARTRRPSSIAAFRSASA